MIDRNSTTISSRNILMMSAMICIGLLFMRCVCILDSEIHALKKEQQSLAKAVDMLGNNTLVSKKPATKAVLPPAIPNGQMERVQ